MAICAIASKKVLTLTWWPLARDCSYYSMTLLALAMVYMFGPGYNADSKLVSMYVWLRV